MTTTKRIKKLIAMLLVFAMVLSTATVYAAAANTSKTTDNKVEFTDVSPNAWYYEAVMALADAGILKGYGNGKFGPEDPVTYGQMAVILMRLSVPVAAELPPAEGYDYYTMNMHNAYVFFKASARINGNDPKFLVNGNVMPASYWWPKHQNNMYYLGELPAEFGNIKPDTYAYKPAQRGQAITYLYNFIMNASTAKDGTKPEEVITILGQPEKNITTANIPDWNKVVANDFANLYPGKYSDHIDPRTGEKVRYAQFASALGQPMQDSEIILKAYQIGLVQGRSNNACEPTGTLTRAEFCQMLYNAGITGSIAKFFPFENDRYAPYAGYVNP